MFKWGEEEDAAIRRSYPTGGTAAVRAALPWRSWQAIKTRASQLGVSRTWLSDAIEKRCNGCGRIKSTSEFRWRSSKDCARYLSSQCYACEAINQRTRSPEAKKAATDRWKAANPERYREQCKRSREKHKERRKKNWRDWYARNRDITMAAQEARRRADPEAYNAKVRARYARDPGPFKAQYHRRRALLMGAEATLTKEQWRSILELFGHRCAYCQEKRQRLTQDHVLPLARGGGHTYENVVPACRPCNSRKQARTPAEAGMKITTT
jgi:5-methylcytosine-specific restriction endonuclease McrA